MTHGFVASGYHRDHYTLDNQLKYTFGTNLKEMSKQKKIDLSLALVVLVNVYPPKVGE